jgi:hypothetical protein
MKNILNCFFTLCIRNIDGWDEEDPWVLLKTYIKCLRLFCHSMVVMMNLTCLDG